jgi:hypothetical protein
VRTPWLAGGRASIAGQVGYAGAAAFARLFARRMGDPAFRSAGAPAAKGPSRKRR